VSWTDWIRTIEVERRCTRRTFAHLGDQIEQLLRSECRVFHFDVGDGHFVEPVTIGPIVLKSIAPIVHRYGAVIDVHLMVENPTKYFEPFRSGGRRQRHVPLRGGRGRRRDDPPRARAGLQAGVAFKPESKPEDVARRER